MKRLLTELDRIREVVNIYPPKGKKKKERKQIVLTKLSELQQKILATLELKHESLGDRRHPRETLKN